MTELPPDSESSLSSQALDTDAILEGVLNLHERLTELDQGFDIAPGDIEDLLGADENDFLGNLATFAIMHDVDPETLFELLDVPAEFEKPTLAVASFQFVRKALETIVRLRQNPGV